MPLKRNEETGPLKDKLEEYTHGIFHVKDDPQSLEFMSEVDKALHRRGHPLAFTLSLATLAFFVVFFLWASFARIDEVTRGEGQVVPAEGINQVQTDKGGTIEKIFVRENDRVLQEQVVATLSNIQEVSALRDLQNKNIDLTLSIIRLEAEDEGKEPEFPRDIGDQYPGAVNSQTVLYNTRKQHLRGEISQLEAQIDQRKTEVAEARQILSKLENQLDLLRKEEETLRPMVGRSVTVIQHLDLLHRIVTQEAELEATRQRIAKAEIGVEAATQRKKARLAAWFAQIAEELSKNRLELASIQERIKISSDLVTNTELRSPITGIVKQIALKEGAVAKPAESIMEIIPADGVLEIVARFRPEDRGFLYVSQEAVIKFVGYDFSIYGGMDANIIRISEDTIEDKRGDVWYEVRFVTKEKNLTYRGKALDILPGMPVMVDVLTDKRTVLDLLIRPLLRAKDTAMTER